MAGNILQVSSSPTGTSGTATRTIVQVAAVSARVKVFEVSVSFKGVTQGNPPVLVQVVRQTTAGTGGTSAPPTRLNRSTGDTILSTGLANIVTTEPTAAGADVVVMQELVHPQTGFTWQARFGAELQVPPGERLGVTVLATVDVGVSARMSYEE